MAKKNIKIAIVYHMNSEIIKNECIFPIQAGRTCSDVVLEMQGDNSGDNISYKNFGYAELTAMYWLWKNSTDDVKGLLHYRRLLNLSNVIENVYNVYGFDVKSDFDSVNLLNVLGLDYNNLDELTNKYEMLIRRKDDMSYWTHHSISSHYAQDHSKELLSKALNIIERYYPEFYDIAVDTCLGTKNYFTNTFIMKRYIFDNCCKWLFDILYKIENNFNNYHRTFAPETANARWAGFLGERLIGIYIQKMIKEGVTYKKFPMIMLKFQPKPSSALESLCNKYSNFSALQILDITIVIKIEGNFINLNECLKSIDLQNWKIYQVFLCCEVQWIADFLKTTYPNFQIFTSCDFNFIISNLKTKYVCFLDAANNVDPDYFINMLMNAEKNKSEIVISSYKNKNLHNNKVEIISPLPHTLYGANLCVENSSDLLMDSFQIFNKLYLVDFLKNIKFETIPTNMVFNWITLLNAHSVSICRLKQCSYNTTKFFEFSDKELKLILYSTNILDDLTVNSSHNNVKIMYNCMKKILAYYVICVNIKCILLKNALSKEILSLVQKLIKNSPTDFDTEQKLEFFYYNCELIKKLTSETDINNWYYIISDYKLDLIIDYNIVVTEVKKFFT